MAQFLSFFKTVPVLQFGALTTMLEFCFVLFSAFAPFFLAVSFMKQQWNADLILFNFASSEVISEICYKYN